MIPAEPRGKGGLVSLRPSTLLGLKLSAALAAPEALSRTAVAVRDSVVAVRPVKKGKQAETAVPGRPIDYAHHNCQEAFLAGRRRTKKPGLRKPRLKELRESITSRLR